MYVILACAIHMYRTNYIKSCELEETTASPPNARATTVVLFGKEYSEVVSVPVVKLELPTFDIVSVTWSAGLLVYAKSRVPTPVDARISEGSSML